MNRFCLLVLFLCLFSCKNKSTFLEEKKQIKIDPTNREEIFDINIPDIFEVIDLETTEKSLLGNIDKILVRNNHIYILDKEIAEAIFVFDSKGKFIYKLDRSGQGPGEYLAPDDFTIDEKTGELLILDIDQKKILYFKDSIFSHEKKIIEDISFLSYSNDFFVGIADYCGEKIGEECHHLFLYDKELNLIKKEEPFIYNPKKIEWDLKLPLFANGQKVFYTRAFSNDIKAINQNKLENFVQIDFGNHNLPQKILDYDRQKLLDSLSKEKGIAFLIDNFMIDENLIYFNFFYNQVQISAFVDSNNFNKNKLFQNILLLERINLTPIYMSDGFIYFLTSTEQMKNDPDYQIKSDDSFEPNPTLLRVKSGELASLLFNL